MITADVISSSFSDVALKMYMPHIQHGVSVHSSSSVEFHWKYFRLWLCSVGFFCAASLTGREQQSIVSCVGILDKKRTLMQADQQVALMLPELFITNTSCLFSLVVLAAFFFFFLIYY